MEECCNESKEEVLTQEAVPAVPQGVPVGMHLGYDDQADLFTLTFNEGDQPVFQCRMLPHNFEQFTADMIKTVKNYNLYQAQLYKEGIEKTSMHLIDQPCCSKDAPCTKEDPQASTEEPSQGDATQSTQDSSTEVLIG